MRRSGDGASAALPPDIHTLDRQAPSKASTSPHPVRTMSHKLNVALLGAGIFATEGKPEADLLTCFPSG